MDDEFIGPFIEGCGRLEGSDIRAVSELRTHSARQKAQSGYAGMSDMISHFCHGKATYRPVQAKDALLHPVVELVRGGAGPDGSELTRIRK